MFETMISSRRFCLKFRTNLKFFITPKRSKTLYGLLPEEHSEEKLKFLFGKLPEEFKSLEESLKGERKPHPVRDAKVNIGYQKYRYYTTKNSEPVDLKSEGPPRDSVDLDRVYRQWELERGVSQIRAIADHYGVFQDSFGDAFFYPCVPFRVYHTSPSSDEVLPVFTGNKVTPSQALQQPTVEWDPMESEETRWTLLMSGLDGNILNTGHEVLHWMVGNIPGTALDAGELLCDYLPPFPAEGLGFQRFVFFLFKHEAGTKLDYSSCRLSSNSSCLRERTFSTRDWYTQYQENLVPAALAFYQSSWDPSVRETFHQRLNMRQPCYEWERPEPFRAQQEEFPYGQPFNEYLDKYRDRRDMNAEILKDYLARSRPFEPPGEGPRWPALHPTGYFDPTWRWKELRERQLRRGKWAQLPRSVD